jgi:serine/threonine protein kinase
MSTGDDLEGVPSQLGRYRLLYRLASGGMASVYLARLAGAGAKVDKLFAVKVMHSHIAAEEAALRMFIDEARIAAAINHPNVCSVFDCGEQEGTHYLVMEYLAGESVSRVTKRLAQTSDVLLRARAPHLAARILSAAAEGLHAAHELTNEHGKPLDVVHRDVSPQNLFVTYEGAVKVVDFGIARARERLEQTRTGDFKGKFEYLAPEQLASKTYDRRVDLWALGVCMWELLARRYLFRTESMGATVAAITSGDIEPPSRHTPGVPPALDAIVLKALERDPDRRFQSGREFSRALRGFLAQENQLIDEPEVGEWMSLLFPQEKARRIGLAAQARTAPPSVDETPGSVPSQFSVSESAISQMGPLEPEPSPGSNHALVGALAALVLVVLSAGGYLLVGPDRGAPNSQLEPAVIVDLPPEAEESPVAAEPPSAVAQTPPLMEPAAAPPESIPTVVLPAPVVADPPPPAARPVRPKLRVPPPVATVRPSTTTLPGVPRAASGEATGFVHVLSKEPLQVFIDGVSKGVTPLHLELPVGSHRIELRMAGMPTPVGQQVLHVAFASEYTVRVD